MKVFNTTDGKYSLTNTFTVTFFLDFTWVHFLSNEFLVSNICILWHSSRGGYTLGIICTKIPPPPPPPPPPPILSFHLSNENPDKHLLLMHCVSVCDRHGYLQLRKFCHISHIYKWINQERLFSTIVHNFCVIFHVSGCVSGTGRLEQVISVLCNAGGQEMPNDVPRRPFSLNRSPKERYFYLYPIRFQRFISTGNLCLCSLSCSEPRTACRLVKKIRKQNIPLRRIMGDSV